MTKLLAFFKNRFSTIFFMLGLCSIYSLSANEYNIIPYPQQLIPQSGVFRFNKHTTVLCSLQQSEILKLAQQFSAQFERVSGMKLSVREIAGADTANTILFQNLSNQNNSESYRLYISPKTISIEAGSPNGFFYGLQSLYQLMPVEIYGKKKTEGQKWIAPAVQITDKPRFAYRGLHLDVCRHFFPLEFIKKYIDAMAIHKLNTFHWHLTDDQGWRIEIKKYPLLTQIGSKRDETLIGHYYGKYPQLFDGKPYGGFYTLDEAREVVAYAKERFITVIPEIEMPGHAQAAVASYPYLSCNRDSTVKVAARWGIFPEVYCPRDSTFRFLEDVLTEIMDIFPSKYIHIGGDECPKDHWKTCPDCQALIKKLELKDENGLQSYFVHRIERFLNSKGRKIIGWDEILDGGLDPNATVMSWRGTNGGITAAKAGNDVIMTPGTYCYFDRYQSDPVSEPLTIGSYLPLNMVYQFEPIPTDLTPVEANHVVGAQANVWTEYMPTTESVEYMVFPRLSAMSEVLWSSKTNRNWDLFRKRLVSQFKRYKELNIKPSNAFYEVQFQSNPTVDHKLQITLSCDYPDAQIRYTLHGKSFMYKKPFILNESADVTAIALIDGKQPGKSVTRPFLISKLTGLSYNRNVNNTWYDGGNANALTDGVQGNTATYTQWVGFGKGMDCEISVDMKELKPIKRFSVGLLHASAMCVVLPTEMKIYGSVDGKNYKLLNEKQIPASTSPNWEMIRPEVTFPSAEIRFLKLQLKSGGACPSEQPDKLASSFIFLDEMCAW